MAAPRGPPATVTERIGLVATATTSYFEPYQVARKFASLDHLSGGRAGWNVVTSVVPLEAANFGREAHYEHGARYARADELVDVVKGLWDSFTDDAFVRDRASGRYYDPAGLTTLNHAGEHFRVRGPLNVSRPPQGHPVIFQAGASEVGRAFAARHGEVIFTAAPTLAAAQAFSADVKARAAGRKVLIWPLLAPLVGDTEAEALRRARELDELIHDDVARRLVQDNIGDVDLSDAKLDEPLPPIPPTNRSKSRQEQMLAAAQGRTLRELAIAFARGGLVAGTPEQIADHIERWHTQGAADGFNVSFPYFPGPATDFVDHVVPELRRRGLLPDEPGGPTLRDRLGLPRPRSIR